MDERTKAWEKANKLLAEVVSLWGDHQNDDISADRFYDRMTDLSARIQEFQDEQGREI